MKTDELVEKGPGIDQVIQVTDKDAAETKRRLVREEGILAGISSGAAAWAAMHVAKRLGKDKVVVTALPDTGERYLSTALFDEPAQGSAPSRKRTKE